MLPYMVAYITHYSFKFDGSLPKVSLYIIPYNDMRLGIQVRGFRVWDWNLRSIVPWVYYKTNILHMRSYNGLSGMT